MKTSEHVFDYLRNQGLVPKYDDRGNIEFKYQMRSFIFFSNDDDAQFFQLTMPSIFEVTDDNRMAALEAMNEINDTTKVIKLTVTKSNHVWESTEIMLDSTPELDDLFPRLLNILLNTRQAFYKLMEV
ncbi:MAG: YbjN domain-containing protein [Bacteroidales bacterium]|nr:YbjN domain-containing protein [Bacteroidales bacterium]